MRRLIVWLVEHFPYIVSSFSSVCLSLPECDVLASTNPELVRLKDLEFTSHNWFYILGKALVVRAEIVVPGSSARHFWASAELWGMLSTKVDSQEELLGVLATMRKSLAQWQTTETDQSGNRVRIRPTHLYVL